jgi:hypothetical protein
MFSEPLARFRSLRFLFALVLLAGVATALAVANGRVASPAAAQLPDPPCPQDPEVPFDEMVFPAEPVVDNEWLPFTPGTQLTLQGRANRGGGLLPHTVTFTITDLVKVIDGVPSVVVWDVDVNEGEVAESELSFFAQDEDGNVWNLGEYPEEFEGGSFAGAPSTWIAGIDEAEAGLHMVDAPVVDQKWLQGFAPAIDFLDCAHVATTDGERCVPIACFPSTLLTRENSPLDQTGGVQLKYHAQGVGIVEVGAENDPEGETLVLTRLEALGPEALEAARNKALELDARGYVTSDVYAQTEDIILPPGVERPPPPRTPQPPPTPPAGQPPGGSSGAGAALPAASKPSGSSKPAKQEIDPDNYTARVDHPLVPLAWVRRTGFRGRDGDTKTRVVTRVLKRKRRVAGVRVTIVDVREFEDGELVEHTEDYYAQDRRGRVWYFGERVNDLENGRVVGHEGQWYAGKNGAKPGLFMPAKPRVGKVFEQERAPGVAEDRSRIVARDVEVTTPAGSFDQCIKTQDFAPLDKSTEFKFYCAGVGLVREMDRDSRLALVRYK